MEVTLIAHTAIAQDGPEGSESMATDRWLEWRGADEADHLAEFAGRACYQSWNRPNPATEYNDGYLAHITEVGHFSVLEHASATFYVTGVSRALTHELIRHRHFSYSQLSQRFVNGEDSEFIYPPALRRELDDYDLYELDGATAAIRRAYKQIVDVLTKRGGLSRKQIREAARCILPNMTETRIVVTGNMRAWREFLAKRYHVAADAEIREFAEIVLKQLRSIAPNTFADIPEVPYGG